MESGQEPESCPPHLASQPNPTVLDAVMNQAEFLTPEECTAVDTALLTARDRFSTRVAIYSLRSLKQIASEQGQAIADLHPHQVTAWVAQDASLRADQGFDDSFKGFFSQLVLSSLKPLKQIAAEAHRDIEALTPADVIAWFEKEARLRIEQGRDATFLKG